MALFVNSNVNNYHNDNFQEVIEIDFDKINSIEDLKLILKIILSAFNYGNDPKLIVSKNSSYYELLKNIKKEEGKNY